MPQDTNLHKAAHKGTSGMHIGRKQQRALDFEKEDQEETAVRRPEHEPGGSEMHGFTQGEVVASTPNADDRPAASSVLAWSSTPACRASASQF
jgi:hypothetical protein